MQNFFTPSEMFNNDRVIITGEEHHHATRSTRVKPGEIIAVTDGMGKRVHAKIVSIDSGKLIAGIEKDISGIGENKIFVTIALSIIHPSHFETAIEKCTEIGVRRFIPLIADRSMFKPERIKKERMVKIIKEAAKQSGRSFFPEIADETTIEELFNSVSGKRKTFFYASKDSSKPISEFLPDIRNDSEIIIVIGPEGDFSKSETELMDSMGACSFNLGGLVLRSETAAFISAGIVLSKTF